MIVVCVIGLVLAISAGFVLGAEVVSFANSGNYRIIAAGLTKPSRPAPSRSVALPTDPAAGVIPKVLDNDP